MSNKEDRFKDIKTEALKLGEFDRAVVLVKMDANGKILIQTNGLSGDIAALFVNFQAFVLKQTMNDQSDFTGAKK